MPHMPYKKVTSMMFSFRSMKDRVAKGLAVTAIAVSLTVPAMPSAFAAPLSAEQTAAVKALVRTTLIENPEILSEALEALKEKELSKMQAKQKATIQSSQKALYHADDPYLGAKKPKVYMAEFFDYNCGYCRVVIPDVLKVAKSEKDTRIVIKELPILGQESVDVSKLALASREQGKYNAFHVALMQSKGRLNKANALNIAEDLGLDTEKLQKDAEGKRVEDTLTRNKILAGMLGIRGTPSFIVGSMLIPGKVDADILAQAISKARKEQ